MARIISSLKVSDANDNGRVAKPFAHIPVIVSDTHAP